ncbi:MAG: deoxyribonuclease V [Thermodesulfobacteriota bacterium]
MIKPLHPWNVSAKEAIRIQETLRNRVILKRTFSKFRTIAGGDVAYLKNSNLFVGAMVVLSYPEMKTIDRAIVQGESSFPYIPGLFSFREGPILIEAFQRLKVRPDLLVLEGHGIAHPRRLGLASHLGLWLDLPTIGCAKTSLLKGFDQPNQSKGSFKWIFLNGEKVGAVLRTRRGVKPVYVSPGHRIDLKSSVQIIFSTCSRTRIPEPLRQAHHLSHLPIKFN